MSTYLKYLTHLGPLAAILLSALGLMSWIPDFLQPQANTWALVATMVLTLTNGLAIMWMFYYTSITRYREGLTIVLYIWFHAAFPELHTAWTDELAILLLTPVVYLLQQTRLNPQAQELAFISTLLLLIGGIFIPEMLWMIPVLWIALIYQQAFTFRTFTASVIALGLAGIYLLSLRLYFPTAHVWDLLAAPYREGVSLSTTIAVELIITGVLVVAIMGQVLWRIHKENNHVRFVVVLCIMMFLMELLLFSLPWYRHSSWSLVLYTSTLIASIYFWQRESVFRGIFFLTMMVLCAVGCFL